MREIPTRRDLAEEFYRNRCYVCQKKFGKYFQFHHLWYNENELIWKDFKNQKEYWNHVCYEIMEQPERFMLLCKTCHSRIDKPRGGLKRMKEAKIVRLFVASLLSKGIPQTEIVPLLVAYRIFHYE